MTLAGHQVPLGFDQAKAAAGSAWESWLLGIVGGGIGTGPGVVPAGAGGAAAAGWPAGASGGSPLGRPGGGSPGVGNGSPLGRFGSGGRTESCWRSAAVRLAAAKRRGIDGRSGARGTCSPSRARGRRRRAMRARSRRATSALMPGWATAGWRGWRLSRSRSHGDWNVSSATGRLTTRLDVGAAVPAGVGWRHDGVGHGGWRQRFGGE